MAAGDLYGTLAKPVIDAALLGRRAARIRRYLGRSVVDVAREIDAKPSDVELFEMTGEASVQTLIRLIETLTLGSDLDRLFVTPKFASLDEVVAWEERRTARQPSAASRDSDPE